MDFPAVTEAVTDHAREAALAINNDFSDVLFAPPLPKGNRCVRVFYAGETDPSERMGGKQVLDGAMVGERIMVIGFWSLTNAGEGYGALVVTEMRAFKHELKTRLLGDSQLNGALVDLGGDFVSVDFVLIGGTPYATVELELVAYLEEYHVAR